MCLEVVEEAEGDNSSDAPNADGWLVETTQDHRQIPRP